MLRMLYSLLNLHTPGYSTGLQDHRSRRRGGAGCALFQSWMPAQHQQHALQKPMTRSSTVFPACLGSAHPYTVKSDCLPTPSRLSQSMSGVCTSVSITSCSSIHQVQAPAKRYDCQSQGHSSTAPSRGCTPLCLGSAPCCSVVCSSELRVVCPYR